MHICESLFLSRKSISDSESSVVLLTKEFWKIRAFRKEWRKQNYSPLDIGTLFEATIESKNSNNRLVSAKVKRAFSTEGYSYDDVALFLETFVLIEKNLIEGAQNKEVYEMIKTVLQSLNQENIEKNLTIFLVKFSMLTGTFDFQKTDSSQTERKLIRAIDEYPFETGLKIQWIPIADIKELKKRALLAFHRHLQ